MRAQNSGTDARGPRTLTARLPAACAQSLTMHTAEGSRRRFAFSTGEVDELRQLVAALGFLSIYVFSLAMLARRAAVARPESVRNLAALGAALLSTAVAAAVHAATPNHQRDDDHPVRTWRDYADKYKFRAEFRFAAKNVPRLIKALGFDADEASGACVEDGYTFSADTAISVLLFTMANGATLQTLNEKFGLKRSKASAVLRWSTRTVYERWHKPLFCTDFKRWAPQFPAWADAAFARQGRHCGYSGVVAFVDGTFFATSRPGKMLQRFFFSGHKWDHGVHFLGVQSPIGLLIDFAGPFEGRHQDKWMLKVNKLIERFEACMLWAATQPFGCAAWAAQLYYLFGDAGFNRRPWLQVQFSGGHLTAAQTACNSALSHTRIVNEWIFGRMEQLWKYLNRESELKVGRGNVGQIITVCAVLTNALTCCDGGNQTSEYFGLTHMVPTLEEYFGGAPAPDDCPPAWYENYDEFPQQ